MPNLATFLFALGSLLSLLGAGAVVVYAGIQRYRDRGVSRRTVRLGAALLGASHAIGFFLFGGNLVELAPFMVAPVLVGYWLLRAGQRTGTGLMLIALGAPGALWWGYFLVRDLLSAAVTYDPILWLWWAPDVAVVVAGGLLVAGGDRAVPETSLLPKAATHVRDPTPIGTAIQRSMTVGPFPIPLLVGAAVAGVVTQLALPLALGAGVPWPLDLLAGAVIFTVIGFEVWYLALPKRLRRAWAGFAVVGNPEMKRWVAATGTRVPTSLPAMRRWLERVPDRPEIRWARAEVVLLTGDVAGARALVERMPTPTDRDRFAQHSLLTYVDWVAGSNPDFEALRVEAETVGAPGSPERLVARGQSIVARAREVAASGGDWMAPLIALRDEVGSRAEQLMREDARRGYYRALFPLGLAVSAITLMVSNLGG